MQPSDAAGRLKAQLAADKELPPVSGRAVVLLRMLSTITYRRIPLEERRQELQRLADALDTTLALALQFAVLVRQRMWERWRCRATTRDWLIAADWMEDDRITEHLPPEPVPERRRPIDGVLARFFDRQGTNPFPDRSPGEEG